jgi:uncharacterized membrane protein YbhN (UPF0104 family)
MRQVPVDDGAPPHRPSLRRLLVRVVLVVVALVGSAVVLALSFEDLDVAEIRAAFGRLGDAELLALGAMWVLWLAAQGLQTAALIPTLPVRRGVVAFLGPTAVSSVVPGPSDLPVRYQMLTSWGTTPSEATLAIAAGGLFSIGIKLVLPVVAAAGLLLSGAPIDRTLRTIVAIGLLVLVGLGIFALLLGSEQRTARAGRLLDPWWRRSMRLLRRPDPEHLADRLIAVRAQALDTIRGRWLMATWGTALTATTSLALLVMALRFTGVPEDAVPWFGVFVVFALVQGLTVLPITAGSAGVSEVAYIGMLTAAAGTSYVNSVAAAVIVFRLLTWIAVILAGLGALAVWRVSLRRARAPELIEPDAGP